jgi:hypothetical protein
MKSHERGPRSWNLVLGVQQNWHFIDLMHILGAMVSCKSPPEAIQGHNDNLIRGHKITSGDINEFHKLQKVCMTNDHMKMVPTITRHMGFES